MERKEICDWCKEVCTCTKDVDGNWPPCCSVEDNYDYEGLAKAQYEAEHDL